MYFSLCSSTVERNTVNIRMSVRITLRADFVLNITNIEIYLV